jgi:hypothetical protein
MVPYVEHGGDELGFSLSFVEAVLFIDIHFHVLLVVGKVGIVAGAGAMS